MGAFLDKIFDTAHNDEEFKTWCLIGSRAPRGRLLLPLVLAAMLGVSPCPTLPTRRVVQILGRRSEMRSCRTVYRCWSPNIQELESRLEALHLKSATAPHNAVARCQKLIAPKGAKAKTR